MYIPSAHLLSFHIRGVRYYDASKVLKYLEPGDKLTLVPQGDNPYDPEAVEIYFHGTKLGYVPREMNSTVFKMLTFGWHKALRCRILSVNPAAPTYQQIEVGIFIKDRTNATKKQREWVRKFE